MTAPRSILLSLFAAFVSVPVWADTTPAQKIDGFLDARLKEQGIEPLAPVDDNTFLRRTWLTLGGRIPTIEEAEAFHSSTYENKRERLVAELLDSEAFVSHYFHFWADLLRVNQRLRGPTKNAYELWIKEALRDNMPYDEFVYKLVTATGPYWENGATGYYFRDRGMPLDNMSNTVRVFLGTRLECAQCHNHPFDKWTQMDYFQMAAFSFGMDYRGFEPPNRTWAQQQMREAVPAAYQEAVKIDKFPYFNNERALDSFLKRNKNKKNNYLVSNNLSEQKFRQTANRGIAAVKKADEYSRNMTRTLGSLYNSLQEIGISQMEKQPRLPHDYQYDDAKPKETVLPDTMFGADIDHENADSLIEAYGEWMTSAENPYFTRVIVNRLWKEVFGIALVEPLDEFSEHTPISHPDLLVYLEQLMKELDYDIKAYLEVLYQTKAYQRRAHGEDVVVGLPYYFQGPAVRRMSAEQIWDSVVSLSIPNADQYQPGLKQKLTDMERRKRIYDSLENRSQEDYLAMMKKAEPIVSRQTKFNAQISEKVLKARKAEDFELVKKLNKERDVFTKKTETQIREIAFADLPEKVSADEVLAMAGMTEMAAGSMSAMTPQCNPKQKAVVTALPKIERPKPPAGLERAEIRTWQREQQLDLNDYRRLIAGMARASELSSPAKPGHFLRDFGQSDRDLIDNANDQPNVPQALNLLNGTMISALSNQFAVFGKRVHEAETQEEKARMIFQAMLTRQPTERELQLVSAEVERDGEQGYEGVVWALLNSHQFMFVE